MERLAAGAPEPQREEDPIMDDRGIKAGLSEASAPGATQRRALLAGIGGIAAGAFLGSRAEAGPLAPPPGPPTPTARPLGEIEPRILIGPDTTPGDATAIHIISQPGSYYLGGDVAGETGKSGIIVMADGVAIDLMGFRLEGAPGAAAGIRTDAVRRAIAIRNGFVVGWPEGGINLVLRLDDGDIVCQDCVVEHVVAQSNGSHGILLGANCIARHCVAAANAGAGIQCQSPSAMALDSIAQGNGQTGIVLGLGGLASNCQSTGNGIDGYFLQSGARAAGCGASSNTRHGFQAANSSVVSDCTSIFNGSAGVLASSINNLVSGCLCVANNSEGIGVNGIGNRLQGNTCLRNAVGIRTLAGRNLIVGNTCGSNTASNWEVSAGNSCLVVQAATTGAISGNSGGESPGSTDPNANYTIV